MAKLLRLSKVDRPASRKALADLGYRLVGWAEVNKINYGTLKQFFGGTYPPSGELRGAVVKKIVSCLRKSKALVLIQHDDLRKAA